MLAAAVGYEFEVDRGPDWLWVRVLSPKTEVYPALSLAEQLKELVETHFVYRVVLELQELSELSSEPILSNRLVGEIVELNQFIRAHEGVLRICGLTPQTRKMLKARGLDDLYLNYDTREEAICGSCGPQLPR